MSIDAAGLTDLVTSAAKRHGVPGVQVGLLSGSDRLVVSAGVLRVGGAETVRGDTRFHAGSLAKALTGEWVLEAASHGRIDLDAPCSDQAPMSWPETPRTLLTQTSGRANELPGLDEDLDNFVARVGAMAPYGAGRFAYCNAGWSALDLLLRQTTGLDFAARLEQMGGVLREPDGAAVGHAPDEFGVPQEVPGNYGQAAAAAGACWWTTADDLLDLAARHLHPSAEARAGLLSQVWAPATPLPGASVFDAWGMGFASWHRGEHEAFGWAGFTGGHRSFLRCFPRQGSAIVVLTNSAGGLFGGSGGAAVFDELLPDLIERVGAPPLPDPDDNGPRWHVGDLAGQYGPVPVVPEGTDSLRVGAHAFGAGELIFDRAWGDTYVVRGKPPGAIPVAFDADPDQGEGKAQPQWLYVGPFAVPRAG